MKSHKDLIAWQKSIDFVTDIYQLTKIFPIEERYCLTSQLRRASVSVPSNIAEGAARSTKKEFRKFLYVALGSLSEVETQLLIGENLGYIVKEENVLNAKLSEIRRIILGLISSIEK